MCTFSLCDNWKRNPFLTSYPKDAFPTILHLATVISTRLLFFFLHWSSNLLCLLFPTPFSRHRKTEKERERELFADRHAKTICSSRVRSGNCDKSCLSLSRPLSLSVSLSLLFFLSLFPALFLALFFVSLTSFSLRVAYCNFYITVIIGLGNNCLCLPIRVPVIPILTINIFCNEIFCFF